MNTTESQEAAVKIVCAALQSNSIKLKGNIPSGTQSKEESAANMASADGAYLTTLLRLLSASLQDEKTH